MFQYNYRMDENLARNIIQSVRCAMKDFEELFSNDDAEWDLTRMYVPKWACIWNKQKYIGKKCVVMVKDDNVAVVHFVGSADTSISVDKVYRLEDLELESA